MSSQQPSERDEPGVSDAAVARYLREHPDFFEHHPELLASLKLRHPQTGAAVSLIERQVGLLREQNRQLENKLSQLIEVARDNERLSHQLHAFSNELLGARTLADVVAVTQDILRQLFDTDYVAVRLLEDVTGEPGSGLDAAARGETFAEFFADNKPVCGRAGPEQIEQLFGGDAEAIGSVALVPLVGVRELGVLALGSRDPERFHPGMGDMFLTNLGDLVSNAVAIQLESRADAQS